MFRSIKIGILSGGIVLSGAAMGFTSAFAQAVNPLRPAPSAAAPSAPATAPAVIAPTAAPAEKAKRARSPAQLANDNRMRACGAEWRTNKAALTAQGKNWRGFSVECRARLKAAGQ